MTMKPTKTKVTTMKALIKSNRILPLRAVRTYLIMAMETNTATVNTTTFMKLLTKARTLKMAMAMEMDTTYTSVADTTQV
mmetsp:Transcript_22929/g.36815  ORF Transcript_22929/g.36815 Transcript_22929/m.36815 type:complete len:80 (+) Transcript_22929:560-799(+)